MQIKLDCQGILLWKHHSMYISINKVDILNQTQSLEYLHWRRLQEYYYFSLILIRKRVCPGKNDFSSSKVTCPTKNCYTEDFSKTSSRHLLDQQMFAGTHTIYGHKFSQKILHVYILYGNRFISVIYTVQKMKAFINIF